MKSIEETLQEIKSKVDVLANLMSCEKKSVVKDIMTMDIMQTLILAEYKLKDPTVSEQEKMKLCDMLTLLFMQVRKFKKIGVKK